ncbi:MAG: Stp1/IreP family PP2C-type Ser/Thr phosphatase [Acidobacteria bacterium]|nr:MAG: Stp1/IreP family PP2C-type Ser/Thr phosphatase [Acidobacteriota bacterium]REK08583.1 MAG: Stp1/IreP family PP2C-type Ser/Thr phosphatase [Acidobacteriota bacterium]
MQLRVSGLTDVGLARKHNEDCFEIVSSQQLFVVADGMGGHTAGEVASKIAVKAIRDFIVQDGSSEELSRAERLREAVKVAHAEVLSAIRADARLQGMGTTVVTLLIEGQKGSVAHVGDSRAYRLRDGRLELLTQDHTWVHEQVQAGYLSHEQAKHHPLKNVVTRALGSEKEVLVDVQDLLLEPGDIVLICSDGLTTMLEDHEIQQVVEEGGSPEDVCRRLVQEANTRGGLDNVTVILLEADEETEGAS